MSGYTPLFGSIITSSIWNESNETRIVWITMLAMADCRGIVEGSVPGLAHVARVETEQCRKALERLAAPDPDSRTLDNEGRRIHNILGGWQIYNLAKFRQKAKSRSEYMRFYREERKRKEPKEEKKEQTTNTNTNKVTPRNTCNSHETPKEEQKGRFTPPSVSEIQAYIVANPELGNIDAVDFFKGYADGGWIDTKGNPVRNWKLKLRTRSKFAGEGKPGIAPVFRGKDGLTPLERLKRDDDERA